MKSLLQEKDAAFWEKIRKDPGYADIINQIREDYDSRLAEGIGRELYSERMLFYKTGDRSRFEKTYFHRRHLLDDAAILALLYPGQEEYLVTLQDCIMAVCEEHCWALPAHTDGTLEDEETLIDLFSAETAFELAEILAFLENRLDHKVKQYIRKEVKRRVLDAFENRRQAWEDYDTNWASVCAGSVGSAMMYLDPEMFTKYLPRLLSSMDHFLSGYPEDGTCLEGVSYWGYGFGAFVFFADLLCRFTDGKTDLFDQEKVKNIASYMQRNFLMGDTTVSFADSERHGKSSMGMQYFLHLRYPDAVQLLSRDKLSITGNSYWFNFSRALFYYDPSLPIPEPAKTTYFLPDAGQYITTRSCFSFAVKGGHNQEPHNHNDLGTFIISTPHGQEICDLGCGLYTRQYFAPGERYKIFCNSSLSHNVPIINGREQPDGLQYNSTIRQDGDTVTVDFANAYSIDGLSRLIRTFCISDTSITLTDCWDLDFDTFTERFVTTFVPTVTEDRILLKDVSIQYDPGVMTVSLSTKEHLLHQAGISETVYCMDFSVKKGEKTACFTFHMGDGK